MIHFIFHLKKAATLYKACFFKIYVQQKGHLMSDALNIGKQLVQYCQQGKNMEAIETLYDQNIVSVEAMEMPQMGRQQEGIEAIKAKNEWWLNAHEVHSAQITGPFPNGERFAVNFNYDISNKETGQRTQMSEVGLYTIENGKITREEYFYPTEG